MGTGGTLPTNITQQVTLYNTTGVIEKDKGIYFCPFIANNLQVARVFGEWLRLFKSAVNYDANSPYSNITISQWNPKDRSLVIKGNADDFRLITEEGKCFNYLILSRTVTKGDDNEVHYYAFFITDVQQAGQGSVRLELQPDDFTNVFYLHNRKRVRDYATNPIDVFNERLKNCYVNRQHYNRVSKEDFTDEYYYGNITEFTIFNSEEHTVVVMELPFNPEFDFGLQIGSTPSLEPFDPDQHYYDLGDLISYEVRVENNKYLLECHYPYQDVQGGLDHCETVYTELDDISYYHLHEDNLPIFSQIEEGFKYKRQIRDYKEFINYGDPLTEEEKQGYENAETWNDLTSALKIKALKLSTAFAHLTFNTTKCFISDIGYKNPYHFPSAQDMPNVEIKDSLIKTAMPIFSSFDILKKFKTEILNIFDNIEFRVFIPDFNRTYIGKKVYFKQKTIISILNGFSPYPEYLVSAYVSKESSLINYIEYYEDKIVIPITDKFTANEEGYLKPLYLPIFFDCDVVGGREFVIHDAFIPDSDIANLMNSVLDRTTHCYYHLNSSTDSEIDLVVKTDVVLTPVWVDQPSGEWYAFCMVVEPEEKVNFDINLSERYNIPNVKEDYYDTVLTFNPYSFWSVSYLGRIEVPLNKLNYYENPIINCELFVSVRECFKYSFVPTYEVGGKKIKYYTESIEQTLSNQLTIASSRLFEYMIANNSQMKNQYAVNDLNHEYGLITTAVSGVGNIAGGIGKGAIFQSNEIKGVGALTGGVQAVTGLINEAIDWDKDTKQISMNQKAKLADMGNLPSNLKQVGTDIIIDLSLNELGLYLNHYRIDEVSYNSICKYLERFGYTVNIYDSLHVNSRVGWDFVQLNSFDYDFQITVEQEDSIRQIFQNGVTLLHDHSVMTSGHNYETILD